MKRFKMKAKGRRGEVWLYDVIGDSWDGTTAKQFAADLRALGDIETLVCYVNSPGGSVFDGVAIHNQLARHQARKEMVIDGIAASIASVICMAGDDIAIAENGMMMIHDPWAMAVGTAEEMRKTAESLDKVRETLVDTYAKRSNTEADAIAAMMAEETWLTAEEAVEIGLADRVAEAVKMAALTRHDLSRFRRVPTALSTLEEGDQEPEPPAPSGKHKLITLARARLGQHRAPNRAQQSAQPG